MTNENTNCLRCSKLLAALHEIAAGTEDCQARWLAELALADLDGREDGYVAMLRRWVAAAKAKEVA